MPARDLDLLIQAAEEAGRIATQYTGKSAKAWHKPGDLGPVTEADLAVNEMLHRELAAARPDYGWLSEETEDSNVRLGHDRIFIVDPIDGTRSFIEGADTWAHSLAVSEGGVITAAAVFLPLKKKLYTAAAGQGAFLNGVPIRASDRAALTGASMIAAKPNYDPSNWRGGLVPDVRRVYRPSLAYRLSLVAEGRFDAMLTLRDSWEWDIAAGDLILREAGATITDRFGAPLRFNNPYPQVKGVVAAGSALHGDLSDRLAQWP
ncbi:3'(2'),5'-bisphosphate nucleotidase CysQ [Thalassobius vesicularis]|uniref:3'(2'),5'-bisphosphate nucleotidase CysQ n=1 Tax=Thalassobius vesicularis TaxID=1294297 RepID=A0A4S3MCW6_9RHOB|nr:3'(2'),5'-bisphosphate nucleotidase CysQ [Thalassobius vesicularis]THD76699.1 3'(2'),5'-bisphosphate nucleotidase CysQ [Thalassobius vesicularis]